MRNSQSFSKNADFASASHSQLLAQVALSDLRSPQSSHEKPSLSPSVVRGYYLRSKARELLKREGYGFRLRFCGAKISRRERGVEVYRRPDRAYGRVGGVCVCGQSVACPVCAPRIAAFRSAEVAEAYSRARNAGWDAQLETFTIPHDAGNVLGEEIDTFSRAWRMSQGAGRAGERIRKLSLGAHAAREMTYGRSGWNYHLHALRYVRPGTYEPALIQAQWIAALRTVGRFRDGVFEHAFRSERVRDEAGARYVAKIATAVDASARAVGLEVAGSANKGRNIVRLLDDYSAGDVDAGRVWVRGVVDICTRKISSVRWTPLLRQKLGFVAPEKSDELIAEEERTPSDELLGELTAMQWGRVVASSNGEFLLRHAAQDGREAVDQFLASIGAGQLHTEGLPDFRTLGGRHVP